MQPQPIKTWEFIALFALILLVLIGLSRGAERPQPPQPPVQRITPLSELYYWHLTNSVLKTNPGTVATQWRVTATNGVHLPGWQGIRLSDTNVQSVLRADETVTVRKVVPFTFFYFTHPQVFYIPLHYQYLW